jgi:hypothetical protein
MEHSLPWKFYSCSANQKTTRFAWNLTVHYGLHAIPSLDAILKQLQRDTRSHTIFLKSILTITMHLVLCLPSGLFPSYLPAKSFYSCCTWPMGVTWPTQFIRLYLITLVILVRRPCDVWFSVDGLLAPCITWRRRITPFILFTNPYPACS